MSTLLSAASKPDTALVGKWQATEEGDISTITFDKAGYVTFIIKGQVFGGKDYSAQNMTLDMTYEVDTRVKPRNIDLVLTAQGSKQEVKRLRGIYQMVTPAKLKIKINFEGQDRPNNFNTAEDDGTLELDKVIVKK